MNNQEICAYLWQSIIRRAFCPVSTREKKNWIRLYCFSLRGFWEIDSGPDNPKDQNGKFIGSINCARDINLCIDYKIEYNSYAKFNFCFLYSSLSKNSADNKLLMWDYDVDEQYFTFPVQFFLTQAGREKEAIRACTRNDIEAIVYSLVVHPTIHLHINSPINNHEIRLGCGIENPFLYLFQLRYQLCPDLETRHKEKNRLIDLFTEALKKAEKIPANMLLAQP